MARAVPLLKVLAAQGWKRTYEWSDWANAGADAYRDIALAEIAAVQEADVVVVLLPGGYGTHVEIGAALALGKPVVLHAPNRQILDTPYPCVFHYHPRVKILVSEDLDVDEVLACIRRIFQD